MYKIWHRKAKQYGLEERERERGLGGGEAEHGARNRRKLFLFKVHKSVRGWSEVWADTYHPTRTIKTVYASLGHYLTTGNPDIQISKLLASRLGQSTLV